MTRFTSFVREKKKNIFTKGPLLISSYLEEKNGIWMVHFAQWQKSFLLCQRRFYPTLLTTTKDPFRQDETAAWTSRTVLASYYPERTPDVGTISYPNEIWEKTVHGSKRPLVAKTRDHLKLTGIAIEMRTTTSSQTRDDIVNALCHNRKVFIKFSTTMSKKNKKKSTENTDFGFAEN